MRPVLKNDDHAIVPSLANATIRLAAGWFHRVIPGPCPWHHHQTIEVVYHVRGRGVSRTAIGDVLNFGPRDVTIYPARMPHDQHNVTAGEDRCLHLQADGLDMDAMPCLTLNRPNDPYLVRELISLTNGRSVMSPLQQHWLDLRAHALLAFLFLLVEQDNRTQRTDGAADYAAQAFDYIAEHAGHITRLADVADHVGVSHDYLRHIFHACYDMSLKRWHILARIEQAKNLLIYSPLPIKAIATECGFASDRHFCSQFRTEAGITPAVFRRSHQVPH